MTDTTPPARNAPQLQKSCAALNELVALLDIESKGDDIFEGTSPKDRWQRVYGDQVLGQALVAAQRTIESRICHSLSCLLSSCRQSEAPDFLRGAAQT